MTTDSKVQQPSVPAGDEASLALAIRTVDADGVYLNARDLLDWVERRETQLSGEAHAFIGVDDTQAGYRLAARGELRRLRKLIVRDFYP
jgi:hypothetical protein